MSYIEDLAKAIEAEIPEDVLPDGDTRLLFLIYALLARAKGEDVTSEDVHDAWAVWMTARAETHEALVKYSELDAATRAEDGPFATAIRRVARARL
jgi:hypothetical protein